MWLAVALSAGSWTYGATVEFEVVHPSPLGSVEVHVRLSSAILDGVYEAAVIIGSELPIEQFIYSDDWLSMFSHAYPPDYHGGFYEHDVALINRNDTLLPTTLDLGTIAIDGSQAVAGEVYRLWVDADQDGVPSALSGVDNLVFIEDPLFGMGTVSFIPEPNTFVLLGLAVPWVCPLPRQRRRNH